MPDTAGFVVNRLLFPYLFEAVRLMERTGLEPEAIDTCMRLGAGHPLGPLALLDLVGLDVSAAIGRTIGAEIPERVEQLIAEGALGRKAGRGFYTYDGLSVAEAPAEDLPRRRPRDRVDEAHRAEALVRRHPLGDERDQLAGVDVAARGTTTATGTSPQRSSGRGTTAHSATAGCVPSSASSSAGATCSALTLISSLMRSTTKTLPSASMRPRSPVWTQPSASISAVPATVCGPAQQQLAVFGDP